jgi:hypothetical protein
MGPIQQSRMWLAQRGDIVRAAAWSEMGFVKRYPFGRRPLLIVPFIVTGMALVVLALMQRGHTIAAPRAEVTLSACHAADPPASESP